MVLRGVEADSALPLLWDWEGARCELTSFQPGDKNKHKAAREEYVVLTARGEKHRLFKVAVSMWREEMKRRLEDRTPPPMGTIVMDPKGKGWVVLDSSRRNRGEMGLETVARDQGSVQHPADSIYSLSYPEFKRQGWKVKSPPMRLRVGALLDLNGVPWKVVRSPGSNGKAGYVDVETVARDVLRRESPVASHYNLNQGALLALGFKLPASVRKAK